MKRFIAFLLVCFMMLTIQPIESAKASSDFAGGTGTELDPYLIETAEQLDNVRNYLENHFKLIKDIDLGEKQWPGFDGGTGWVPIGGLNNPFMGSLNGNGKSINNLSMYVIDNSYLGLFGSLKNAKILNLSMSNVYVKVLSCNRYCGGLAGKIENSEVINCKIDGSLTEDNSVMYKGGIIGYSQNSVLKNVSFSGEVAGTNYVGGLVGYQNGGIVLNCNVSGKFKGRDCVGSLVGCVSNNDNANLLTVEVKDCFANSNVSGDNKLGGLIGEIHNQSLTTSTRVIQVTNCYSSGNICNGANDVGGLIGVINNNKNNNCLGLVKITNCYSMANINDKPNMAGGLIGRSVSDVVIDYERKVEITKCYSTGNIDGNDYSGGLIGRSICTRIKDCNFNGKVFGNEETGGLIGRTGSDIIDNSYSNGEVLGKKYVGGFIGSIYSTTTDNCYSTCKVIGTSVVGGFIGSSYYSRLTACYFSGSVTGNESVSAFIGLFSLHFMTDNCFYDKNKANQSHNDNLAIPKTTEEMLKKETFEAKGWNFSTDWIISEDITYPYLRLNTQDPPPSPIVATSISINPDDIEITEGSSRSLSFLIEPSVAPDQRVTWSTSDSSIVSVDENGVITAIKEGTATITVTARSSGVKGYTTITVNKRPPSDEGYTILSAKLNNKRYYGVAKSKTLYKNSKRVTEIYINDKLKDIYNETKFKEALKLNIKDYTNNLSVKITAEMLKYLQQNDIKIELHTRLGIVKVNPHEIDVDSMVEKLNALNKEKFVEFSFNIEQHFKHTQSSVFKLVKEGKYNVISNPISFTIACSYKKQSILINEFDSFVYRLIKLPKEYSSDLHLVALKLTEEEACHVPCKIIAIENDDYAELSLKHNGMHILAQAKAEFSDLLNHEFAKVCSEMYAKNLIKPKSKTEFGVNDEVSRDMFTYALVNALGLGNSETYSSFSDINKYYTYFGTIATAEKYKLVPAYYSNKFIPYLAITRQQVAVCLYNALKLIDFYTSITPIEIKLTLAQFSDNNEISNSAKEAVAICTKYDLLPISDAEFKPKASITKAEMALIMQRLLQLIEFK